MNERPLRVLTLSDLFPDPVRPALGIFVAHQVRHLQNLSEQVVVVPLRVFPPARLVRHLTSLRRFARGWRKFRAELSDIPTSSRVDKIEVHYSRYTSLPRPLWPGTWGLFAYACMQHTLHKLHAQQPFHVIHAHCASPSGVIAVLAQRWMRVPVVVSVHGADVTHTAKHDALSCAIVRWVLRNVDAVIVNSRWTAERVRALGAPSAKIRVIHLGAEPPAALTVNEERTPGAPIRLLTVAYLERRKGHALVLHALQTLRTLGYAFRYKIVGDGPQHAPLIALTEQLGLADCVAFEGSQPHDEVWRYFADCDIFVLPSNDEAFGVAYIEALSLGKAVIGCETEGGPEELRGLGDCIELVKPHDINSLVAALRRLIDDPARRRHSGETGRAIVREHFQWPRTAVETVEVYEHVLARFVSKA